MNNEEVMDLAGVRTMVRTSGEGQVPLVLLHGVLSNGASWEDVATPFARARWVVYPDLPLHGRTEAPPEFRPNPAGLVAWLEALFDHLGVQRADLCGLSLGGAVALHFVLAHPHRVRRMVLVDAANVVALDEAYRRFIGEVRQNLEAEIGADGTTSQDCWPTDIGIESARSTAADLSADPIVMSVLAYLEDMGIPLGQVMDGLEFLEPIKPGRFRDVLVPTLAIWGADDPFFPTEEAIPILEAIPDVRIKVMDRTGHNPVAERPEMFVDLVEDFLD
jgi:3-oxoadipate enol-lactonase